MTATLTDYAARIERLAQDLGLDYYPVDFELVPDNFMMEIAVYGLPVRMPHWSFGVRYIHQLIRHGMGHSRIFEVMFPGDPCHAYLVNGNTLPENVLVTAHVLGHADFSRNNELFARSMAMAGGRILEQAAARAHRIDSALTEFGVERVEAVLVLLRRGGFAQSGLDGDLLIRLFSAPRQTPISDMDSASGARPCRSK